MTDDQFDACRSFLENQIDKHPENEKLLAAYVRLIEIRATFDLEDFKAHHERRLKELEAIEVSRAENDKAYHARRAQELESREATYRAELKAGTR